MILRALVDKNDDADLRSGAIKLLRRQSSPLEVCHLTIGEAVAGLIDDNGRTTDHCCDAMREFHLLLKSGSIKVCGIGNHKDAHELALRIHREDQLLEPNDGLILTNALLCKDCRSFHTTDRKVLFSKTVKQVAQEYETKIVPLDVPETSKNRRRTY